jgi:hypothetical protein
MPLLTPQYHLIPGSTSIWDDIILIAGAVVLVVGFTWAWNKWGRF